MRSTATLVLTVISFASATALGVMPAAAQQSQTVTYGELDLNDNEGADTLIRRVEQAADNVCGVRPGMQTLREHNTGSNCALSSTRAAITEIAHPVVTSRYYGRTPDVTIGASLTSPNAAKSVVVTSR